MMLLSGTGPPGVQEVPHGGHHLHPCAAFHASREGSVAVKANFQSHMRFRRVVGIWTRPSSCVTARVCCSVGPSERATATSSSRGWDSRGRRSSSPSGALTRGWLVPLPRTRRGDARPDCTFPVGLTAWCSRWASPTSRAVTSGWVDPYSVVSSSDCGPPRAPRGTSSVSTWRRTCWKANADTTPPRIGEEPPPPPPLGRGAAGSNLPLAKRLLCHRHLSHHHRGAPRFLVDDVASRTRNAKKKAAAAEGSGEKAPFSGGTAAGARAHGATLVDAEAGGGDGPRRRRRREPPLPLLSSRVSSRHFPLPASSIGLCRTFSSNCDVHHPVLDAVLLDAHVGQRGGG